MLERVLVRKPNHILEPLSQTEDLLRFVGAHFD
jgi:hypothetical protein